MYHESTDGDAASETCKNNQTGYERECDSPIVLECVRLEALAHPRIAFSCCSKPIASGAAFTSRSVWCCALREHVMVCSTNQAET